MKTMMLALCLIFTSCGMEYSSGERVGVITKFSNKGLLVKTWEGELKTGFLTKSDTNLVQETFRFSTESVTIANEIKLAMETGFKVKLTYSQKAFQLPFSGNAYKVTELTILK